MRKGLQDMCLMELSRGRGMGSFSGFLIVMIKCNEVVTSLTVNI